MNIRLRGGVRLGTSVERASVLTPLASPAQDALLIITVTGDVRCGCSQTTGPDNGIPGRSPNSHRPLAIQIASGWCLPEVPKGARKVCSHLGSRPLNS